MHAKHLFEYAVVRVVPRVEREEFMNVGVILYCADKQFLQILFDVNHQRLAAFAPKLDIAVIEASLNSFKQICHGGKEAGPIGLYSPAERFRWLTASRSTIVQTSCVHPGLCTDGKEMLERLFEELVKA